MTQKKNRLTPEGAAAMVSAACGETVTARRVLYWSRNGTASFPPLEMATHSKFLRFSRADVEAWIAKNFGGDAKHKPEVRRASRA